MRESCRTMGVCIFLAFTALRQSVKISDFLQEVLEKVT